MPNTQTTRTHYFNDHGDYLTTATTRDAENDLTEARTTGQHIDEWNTTDRDGQPLRITRISQPGYHGTIAVHT